MDKSSATAALAEALRLLQPARELILTRTREIHRKLLAWSPRLDQANFTRIGPRDLTFLYDAYDQEFFGGLFRQALDGQRLDFRLAPRMTRAGGKTTRFQGRDGGVWYEIAVASSILFEGHRESDRQIRVCGRECLDRLEALQRIFEHEMVHLAELVCWAGSDCSAERFQEIARRLFLHTAHTHELITWRERAAATGIRVGTRVAFSCDGERLVGRVNRITKRATVLVEHPDGVKFSDGLRYRTYYVPMRQLEAMDACDGLQALANGTSYCQPPPKAR